MKTRASLLRTALCLSLALPSLALCASPDDADSLILLREAQADKLQHMDAIVEQQIEFTPNEAAYRAAGLTPAAKDLLPSKRPKTRFRFVIDKAKAQTLMQSLGESDSEIKGQIKVEGGITYMQGPGLPDWKRIDADPTTRATLEQLGVDFSEAKQDLRDAKAGKKLTPAERKQRHLAHLAKLKEKFDLRREASLDKGKQKAVSLRPKVGKYRPKGAAADMPLPTPYDEEIQLIDAETGVIMERSTFIRASRWPGGAKFLPDKAAKRRPMPEGLVGEAGDELVEQNTLRVTKTMQSGEAVLPQESESVGHSAVGMMKATVKWKL